MLSLHSSLSKHFNISTHIFEKLKLNAKSFLMIFEWFITQYINDDCGKFLLFPCDLKPNLGL